MKVLKKIQSILNSDSDFFGEKLIYLDNLEIENMFFQITGSRTIPCAYSKSDENKFNVGFNISLTGNYEHNNTSQLNFKVNDLVILEAIWDELKAYHSVVNNSDYLNFEGKRVWIEGNIEIITSRHKNTEVIIPKFEDTHVFLEVSYDEKYLREGFRHFFAMQSFKRKFKLFGKFFFYRQANGENTKTSSNQIYGRFAPFCIMTE